MSPYRTFSWQELVVRLAADGPRDETVWDELRRRLEPYARASLRQAGNKDPEGADDILNRVLLKLFEAADVLKKIARPSARIDARAYLSAMVYNATVDFLRERTRRVRRFSALENPDHLPGSQLPPSHAAEERERWESADELRRILQNLLGREDWDLLRRRFWEDQSIKAIATALGIPYHAAAMRLHRLQTRLSDLMQQRHGQDLTD